MLKDCGSVVSETVNANWHANDKENIKEVEKYWMSRKKFPD